MAYGSTSIIENMATVFVIGEMFFIYFCLTMLIRFICSPLTKFKWFRKYHEKFDKAVFWGIPLRYALNMYLEVAVASQINIRNYRISKNMSSSDLHNKVSFYYALSMGAFVTLFPVLLGIFILRERDNFIKEQRDRLLYIMSYYVHKSHADMDRKFWKLRKFGVIISGIATKYKPQILFYPIFMLRRLLLAVILVQLEEQPWFQIQSMVVLNIAFAAYIGYFCPLESRFENKLELFGEAMNMLATYSFFVFTDWVPDLETRVTWGYTNIAYVSLIICVNMLVIFIDQVQMLIKTCQRKYRFY